MTHCGQSTVDTAIADPRARDRHISSERSAEFTALVQRHTGGLERYLRRRCRNPSDVEDLLAETFLVAWQRFGTESRPVESFPAWFHGIAWRVVANHNRKLRRMRVLEKLFSHMRRDASDVNTIDVTIEVERRLLSRELLESLTVADRRVLFSFALLADNESHLGVLVGASSSAARQRVSRARKRLAKAYFGFDAPMNHGTSG